MVWDMVYNVIVASGDSLSSAVLFLIMYYCNFFVMCWCLTQVCVSCHPLQSTNLYISVLFQEAEALAKQQA